MSTHDVVVMPNNMTTPTGWLGPIVWKSGRKWIAVKPNDTDCKYGCGGKGKFARKRLERIEGDFHTVEDELLCRCVQKKLDAWKAAQPVMVAGAAARVVEGGPAPPPPTIAKPAPPDVTVEQKLARRRALRTEEEKLTAGMREALAGHELAIQTATDVVSDAEAQIAALNQNDVSLRERRVALLAALDSNASVLQMCQEAADEHTDRLKDAERARAVAQHEHDAITRRWERRLRAPREAIARLDRRLGTVSVAEQFDDADAEAAQATEPTEPTP